MDQAKINEENIVTTICICGRTVAVEVFGGQYQNAYYGECEYGRMWSLEELTEVLGALCLKSTA